MNLPPCPSPPSFIELPPFVPLKPCNDNNSHVRMDNEPPKPVLEPSPTFAWTRRDPLRPVSPTGMSGLTPPSSPLAFTPSLSSSSSLSPSSALRGFGFGPIREVRMGGINPRGNNIGCGEEMSLDEPIQLPPIRDSLPADNGSKGMEGITTNNYNVTRFVPVKTETNNINSTESPKGKKLGVSPVSFKKSPSERKTLSNTKQGKIAGILVVHTTTQSTVTSVERKVSPYPAPVSPPFTTTTFTTTTTATPSATLSKKPTSTKNLSSSLLNNNTHNNNTTSDAVACDGNRRRVTPDQLVILEREFERGMIPDLETRKRLAKQLGFTERRVQVWFQNRRAKMKKDNVGPNTPIFIVNCGIDSFKN